MAGAEGLHDCEQRGCEVLSYLPRESSVIVTTWEGLFWQVWVEPRRTSSLRAGIVMALIGSESTDAGFKGHLDPRWQCPGSSRVA